MVNAQEWLDKKYPKSGTCIRKDDQENYGKVRNQITNLDISGWDEKNNKEKTDWEELEGNLDLSDFVNLEELYCHYNKLTSLNVSNCLQLKVVNCNNNQLTNLDITKNSKINVLYCNDNLLTNLSTYSTNLKQLNLSDNDFPSQGLSFLSHLTSLEGLDLSNKNKEKIEKENFNRFIGSLEPLKNLTKLEELIISNTDLNNGLEYLPVSLESIDCSNEERKESKVKEIKEILEKSNDFMFIGNSDGGYAKIKSAQQWLDKNYPKNGTCLNKRDEENFGKKRNVVKKLNISGKGLGGDLDLSDFVKLNDLNCSYNELTNLDMSNCSKLSILHCDNNYLTEINYSDLNSEKIIYISLKNNDLKTQDLTPFSRFADLEFLVIGNDSKERIEKGIYNRFYGNLKELENLTKLKGLNINNTDINEGVKYLPSDITEIFFSTEVRPESKLKKIEEELSELIVKRWQSIHPDFTFELQKEWEAKGFDYKEVKEWILNFSLSPRDSGLVKYLQKKDLSIQEIKNSIEELREEYEEYSKQISLSEIPLKTN